MKKSRCQSCGHEAVARCTGKTVDSFGIVWPGGREQQGYVPPHELTGLRENNASSDYMNFSYCLVCGQIQGEWPTKVGVSHLLKYAEPRLWEVTVCTTSSSRPDLKGEFYNGWYQLYFLAKTRDQIRAHMSGKDGPDSFERYFIKEIAELPSGKAVIEL